MIDIPALDAALDALPGIARNAATPSPAPRRGNVVRAFRHDFNFATFKTASDELP